VISYATADLV